MYVEECMCPAFQWNTIKLTDPAVLRKVWSLLLSCLFLKTLTFGVRCCSTVFPFSYEGWRPRQIGGPSYVIIRTVVSTCTLLWNIGFGWIANQTFWSWALRLPSTWAMVGLLWVPVTYVFCWTNAILSQFLGSASMTFFILFFLYSFFSSFFLALLPLLVLSFLAFRVFFFSFVAFFVWFRFFLFSFHSFIFFFFLCFFSPIDLRLSCVCVVIDTTCNIYVVVFLRWQSE